MKVEKTTIIRTICLVIALVNQVIVATGREAIPVTDDQVYQIISVTFTVVTALVAWWKNNSFTHNAIRADAVKKVLDANADAMAKHETKE